MIKASILIIFPVSKFCSNEVSLSCNSLRSENTFLGDFTGIGNRVMPRQLCARDDSLISPADGEAAYSWIPQLPHGHAIPPRQATGLEHAVPPAPKAEPETTLQRQSPPHAPPKQVAWSLLTAAPRPSDSAPGRVLPRGVGRARRVPGPPGSSASAVGHRAATRTPARGRGSVPCAAGPAGSCSSPPPQPTPSLSGAAARETPPPTMRSGPHSPSYPVSLAPARRNPLN